MSERRLPVRPNLDQLRRQAKDLLRAFRRGDPDASADFQQYHPDRIGPASVKLADAQLVLARSYQAPRERIVLCCRLVDAIWRDDRDAVRQLVVTHPHVLHENAGIRNNNGGPPMSYAANIGRNRIIEMLHELGATGPPAKHQILELYAEHGFEFPDTPAMGLHRGRIDLLENQLRRDPALLTRTFAFQEIFPPALDCHEERHPRTTLAGATLLHICVEFAEVEIARWLLGRGMAVDAPAAVDADGFGGHTALFGAVVSYPNFWPNYGGHPDEAPMARLLLEHGADPSARASMREHVMDNRYNPTEVRLHRDLTPLAWGEVFHNQIVVSRTAMRLIAERGGRG